MKNQFCLFAFVWLVIFGLLMMLSGCGKKQTTTIDTNLMYQLMKDSELCQKQNDSLKIAYQKLKGDSVWTGDEWQKITPKVKPLLIRHTDLVGDSPDIDIESDLNEVAAIVIKIPKDWYGKMDVSRNFFYSSKDSSKRVFYWTLNKSK